MPDNNSNNNPSASRPQAPATKPKADIISKIVDKINATDSILVALSDNPSVDELSAAIGLTMLLDRISKHATAIFSGKIPNALEFLKPEETLEKNTDSLRDFIIALNKEKADHIRYMIEGDFVRIYITPYRTTIDEKDLDFSHGDYNVDLVISINVENSEDLDDALSEYGRIMHDAVTINISNSAPGHFAEIEWSNPEASSVCEMVITLAERLGVTDFDQDIATALLTGIVSSTERFSNSHTTPDALTIASKLMSSGADQQLISNNIMQKSILKSTKEEAEFTEPSEKEESKPTEAPKEDSDSTKSSSTESTDESTSPKDTHTDESDPHAESTSATDEDLIPTPASVALPQAEPTPIPTPIAQAAPIIEPTPINPAPQPIAPPAPQPFVPEPAPQPIQQPMPQPIPVQQVPEPSPVAPIPPLQSNVPAPQPTNINPAAQAAPSLPTPDIISLPQIPYTQPTEPTQPLDQQIQPVTTPAAPPDYSAMIDAELAAANTPAPQPIQPVPQPLPQPATIQSMPPQPTPQPISSQPIPAPEPTPLPPLPMPPAPQPLSPELSPQPTPQPLTSEPAPQPPIPEPAPQPIQPITPPPTTAPVPAPEPPQPQPQLSQPVSNTSFQIPPYPPQ